MMLIGFTVELLDNEDNPIVTYILIAPRFVVLFGGLEEYQMTLRTF